MTPVTFIEREMKKPEFARMCKGFHEHSLEHGSSAEAERFGFVALNGEKFIGCSSGLSYKDEQGYNSWFHLTDLFVEVSYRKQGVGKELLGKLEARIRALGIRYIYTWTAGYEAPGFYAKQGYQIFTELEGYYRSGHSRVGLRKTL